MSETNQYKERIREKIGRGAEERKTRFKKTVKKIIYWLIGLAIILVAVWRFVVYFSPQGPDFSAAVEILGREHIADGSSYSDYNSNPPSSGPHYSSPAIVKFYDEELTDEKIVHNLEHGHIWISYKPNLSAEIMKVLKKLAGNNVIVSPRSKNDTDIALAAWGRLDKFNIENGILDAQRIRDFILRYQNKAPENSR